jgi:hypothetical protein
LRTTSAPAARRPSARVPADSSAGAGDEGQLAGEIRKVRWALATPVDHVGERFVEVTPAGRPAL